MNQDFSNIDEVKEMISDSVIGGYIVELLEFYGSFGPVPGLLLPFIEAFFPFLPVIVFILANSIVYGLIFGFLFSWIGAATGSILVFILIRKLERFNWVQRLKEQKQVNKVISFFDRHGFGPIFLLLCFPFSPSALINVVAAFTRISLQQFALAVLLGKAAMIFSVSYVGDSIASFAQNPFKTVIVGACIGLFWIIGKYMEKRIQSRAEKVSEYDFERKED
ncbi:TVP38/TMEM64 family protein [Aquisalibacillus elongatus]|uniref:TVP38/TMEM64 family membrane protein n=1 Tax=Aquisalibacillus elongatus TaxID=485577 RepID=A0A3N5B4L0_9BACI|nr:TVP38/TMEM64 family protein [Aquisalibacillus elongatus]RPF52049.1 putative membrane protein YdjX (TVP38/TMEM64 family) [Aquisalibacillus elongatus]